jgi:hypothetical protein
MGDFFEFHNTFHGIVKSRTFLKTEAMVDTRTEIAIILKSNCWRFSAIQWEISSGENTKRVCHVLIRTY